MWDSITPPGCKWKRHEARLVSVSAGVLMNQYITHIGKYDWIHNLRKRTRNPKSHGQLTRQHWDQHRYPTNEGTT